MTAMKLYKLTVKILLAILLIALPITWLLATNSGLNTVLSISSLFAYPANINYEHASGQIIGKPIQIHNITVKYNKQIIFISQLTINWQMRSIEALNIDGIENFLPRAQLLNYQAMHIDRAYAHIKSIDGENVIGAHFSGKSDNTPMDGAICVTRKQNIWDLVYVQLRVGKNSANIQQDKMDNYQWRLNLIEPKTIFKNSSGGIIADGMIRNVQTVPNIQAKINSKFFTLNDYTVKNLHSTINLRSEQKTHLTTLHLSADSISVAGNAINDVKINLAGHTTFAANGNKINLHGTVSTIPTDLLLQINNKNDAEFKLNMHLNEYNKLSTNLRLKNDTINGDASIVAEDLTFLMQFVPDITRLKAKLNSNIQISGVLDAPIIISHTSITNITATIPSLGVKIKPMELHMHSDKHGKFTITGKGQMRRGPGEFQLQGYIEPFKPNMPNDLNFIGKNIEFINNNMARLIASSYFNLHYVAEKQQLDITGDIAVHEGNITIADQNTQTIKSQDVVFIDAEVKPTQKLIVVNPNICLHVEEKVRFNGFGLDANIGGKLNIVKRHNALYADGRITIKEGFFKLPGQRLAINHGRLLYPPGTLLRNPVLDIKMISNDLELTVQNTAQKPILVEHSLAGNKDKLITQALITGSSMLSKNFIQDKLQISEIGLTSNDDTQIEFFDDPGKGKVPLKNKDIVIGRKLGKRVYLQYLHGLGEANKRVRLKYSLNNIWAIGLESNTEGGGGADLSFMVERD